MSPPRVALRDLDLRRLAKAEAPEVRAAETLKLCAGIADTPLTERERLTAEAILRVLADDAAEMVRRSLAQSLKASPLLPRDVAAKLARDVYAVALPVLQCSPALTEDELIEIVRGGDPARQVAIARRETLGPKITYAIVSHAAEDAVRAVCANDGAQMDVACFDRAVDRFPQSDAVTRAIVHRRTLPVSVAERLIRMVGSHLQAELVRRHALTPETAIALVAAAGERTRLDMIDAAGRAADPAAFVRALNRRQQLTPSFLLRALCRGRIAIFEHGVSELAGVPHARAWIMIHDGGPLGLRAIYDRAGLPARLFSAFRTALEACKEIEQEGWAHEDPRRQDRLVQRLLTQRFPIPREELAYLMERLDLRLDDARPEPTANAA